MDWTLNEMLFTTALISFVIGMWVQAKFGRKEDYKD